MADRGAEATVVDPPSRPPASPASSLQGHYRGGLGAGVCAGEVGARAVAGGAPAVRPDSRAEDSEWTGRARGSRVPRDALDPGGPEVQSRAGDRPSCPPTRGDVAGEWPANQVEGRDG